jgi:predicted ChrR family anti-sigma factor
MQSRGRADVNYDPTIRPADGRPIDALIAAYAAKTLSVPLTALVTAHLELKPDNRAYVAALEAVQGVFLEEVRPIPLAGRDRRLVNIFSAPPAEPARRTTARAATAAAAALPQALRHLAGCDLSDFAWQKRGTGIKDVVVTKDVVLTLDGAGEARFVSVRSGKRLPLPREDGLAAALVLEGTASDAGGTYARGDIVFPAQDPEDAPVAEGGRDCVCFIVAEGPTRAPGAFDRVVNLVKRG